MASMCAGSHKYRPSRDQTGGLTGKVDISLEMGPVGDLWVTRSPWQGIKENL